MKIRTNRWLPAITLAGLVVLLGACTANDDEGSSAGTPDISADATQDGAGDGGTDSDVALPDLLEDTVNDPTPDPVDDPTPDPVDDPTPDPVDDPTPDSVEDTSACDYPTGPYAFTAVGNTVGPMNWPSAVTGPLESLPPDIAELFCDPDVHSIFIQIAATYCTSCPSRMEQIAGLQDHWETYGAKWIFVINDVSTAAQADAYVNRYDIDFGWRTADTDNSEGASTIGNSTLFNAVPWTGVIRTSDMHLVYDEPDTSYLDIEAIAIELSE